MERESEFKIWGGASKEKKEEAEKKLKNFLYYHLKSLDQELPSLKRLLEERELPKTEQEIKIIEFANQLTSQLMQECGVKPFNIPTENIHIVPLDLFEKLTKEKHVKYVRGTTLPWLQGIFLKESDVREHPIRFASVVLHEILHLKGYVAWRIKVKNESFYLFFSRAGVSVFSTQPKPTEPKEEFVPHAHLVALNEAIVSVAEAILLEKMLDLPMFEKEKKWLQSEEGKKARRIIANALNIIPDDIFWVDPEKLTAEIIPHYEQRVILYYLCSEIKKEFPDQYKTSDDVFINVFLKAHFTGNLLEMGRLIRKTFGKEALRLIADLKIQDAQDTFSCLKKLKELRERQNNKNSEKENT